MPSVWELFEAGDGETQSDFFATKAEAERLWRSGNREAELIRHHYEPTQEGVAKLLNHIAGWYGRRP